VTDRLKGVVVTFDESIREDDAETLIQAIYQLRNVLTVRPIVDNFEDQMNRDRVKNEFRSKLFAILKD
jgi:hypothetical protein